MVVWVLGVRVRIGGGGVDGSFRIGVFWEVDMMLLFLDVKRKEIVDERSGSWGL